MSQIQTEPPEQMKGAAELDNEAIERLLDKRSDLMKKGRVKRVYYEVREDVQNSDARAEFEEEENRFKE